MASVFKRKGRKRYYIAYRDANGLRRILVGTASKEGSRRIAERIESEIMLRKRGLIDPALEKLATNEGLSLPEHLIDFEEWMESRGCSEDHIAETLSNIRQINSVCGFTTPSTLDASRVSSFLADLRRSTSKRRGLSPRRCNAKLTSLKTFTHWLYENDRLRSDPMKSLKLDRAGERQDRRRRRRTLDDQEIARVIQAAENGPVVLGLTGRERATAYLTSLGTGFRRKELNSLTPRHFDLTDPDHAVIRISAGSSKDKCDDALPISGQLARTLADYIRDTKKLPDARLFHLPHKTCEMLQVDLVAAGVPYADASGRTFDFHSWRHCYITRLARSGVSPGVCQRLARHKNINLTMNVYSHVLLEDQRTALGKVPEIDLNPGPRSDEKGLPVEKNLRATGTDNLTGADSG